MWDKLLSTQNTGSKQSLEQIPDPRAGPHRNNRSFVSEWTSKYGMFSMRFSKTQMSPKCEPAVIDSLPLSSLKSASGSAYFSFFLLFFSPDPGPTNTPGDGWSESFTARQIYENGVNHVENVLPNKKIVCVNLLFFYCSCVIRCQCVEFKILNGWFAWRNEQLKMD